MDKMKCPFTAIDHVDRTGVRTAAISWSQTCKSGIGDANWTDEAESWHNAEECRTLNCTRKVMNFHSYVAAEEMERLVPRGIITKPHLRPCITIPKGNSGILPVMPSLVMQIFQDALCLMCSSWELKISKTHLMCNNFALCCTNVSALSLRRRQIYCFHKSLI